MPPRQPSIDPTGDPIEGPGVVAAMLEHWKIASSIIAGLLLMALVLLSAQPRVFVASTRVSFVDPQAVPFPRSNTRLQDDLNRYLARIADMVDSETVLVDAAERVDGIPEEIDNGLTVSVVAPAAALDLKLTASDRQTAEAHLEAVVDALSDETERTNRDATTRTRASIDAEIARVEEDIDVGRDELAIDPASIASQQVLTSNLTLRASLIEKRNELDTNASAIGNGISRVEGVAVRASRSGPGVLLGVPLALSLGVLAAAVVCWVLATRRPRVMTAADPGQLLGAPLLTTVPSLRRREPGALRSPPSPPAEASAVLAAALRPWRSNVVVITGVKPGDGASTVSMNLAVSLALGGRRVVLVDADLRRCDLTRRLGFVGHPGLGDVGAEVEVDSPNGDGHVLPTHECQVRRFGSSFQFVPSGTVDPELSGSLLWAPAMANCIAELASTFDAVIVDTPPIDQHPDAVAMVDRATSFVLVTRRGALMADVASAAAVLTASGVNLAGYVFTRADPRGSTKISPWTYQRGGGEATSEPLPVEVREPLATDPGRRRGRG